ncbi:MULTISPECIES: R3H domain-containing nucleic acid-binding protein [unclassified Leptolyngbya]|uniref:Jag family protein n=1 Tax=unclassified Leptolyngbya TaxID=2650499 RepID=UPI001681FC81|nr:MULTISPECIES: R3H domain-containing nucleic acid-binding protein [unclassified Leptolyngbya]MBD1911130.1 RNA-binding protein [Leptolyngbya sp. FACHB-8]MBD2154329.1 RNA-binding protein [Leptolyngbya sp. FACHB-16]
MDDKVQQGESWLENLLQLSGLDASVKHEAAHMADDGSCWIEIDASSLTPEQIQALTGSHGEVLDSMQYLINTTLNLGKQEGSQQPYTIELNGYRARRQAELKQIAENAVNRVLETGEEYEIPSLSSAERRQVHTYLKDYEHIKTESRGQEPDRRLVVRRLD